MNCSRCCSILIRIAGREQPEPLFWCLPCGGPWQLVLGHRSCRVQEVDLLRGSDQDVADDDFWVL